MSDLYTWYGRWGAFYLGSIIVGGVFNIVACATNGWYFFESTEPLSAINLDIINRKQVWKAGLYGISVVVTYCEAATDFCYTDVNQFRYYDNTKNAAHGANGMWKDEYIQPAKIAGETGDNVRTVMICTVVFGIICLGALAASLVNNHVNQERCTQCMIFVATLTGFMNFFMLAEYNGGTEEIRALLEKKSFVMGVTGPKLEPHFSITLAWIGSVITALGIFPTMKIVQRFHEPEDAAAALVKVRDRRIKQYLTDTQNTSHGLEAHPEDSLGYLLKGSGSQGSQKYQGWTVEIETMPVNQFTIDPSKSIGGFRIREVEQEVPNTYCCGAITCGTKKIMVKQSAETIKPPKVLYERRAEEAKKEAERIAKAKKEGVEGVGLPSQPRQVVVEQERHEIKMRPISPRGPMGGTFSGGFMKDIPGGKPVPASAGYRKPGEPYNAIHIANLNRGTGFTGMEATPFSSVKMPSYLEGFDNGGFQSKKGTKVESDLGFMTKMPDSVKTKMTGKMPDGSDAMGSATFVFSETGQPLAARTRVVTRAPKPEKRDKKDVKL